MSSYLIESERRYDWRREKTIVNELWEGTPGNHSILGDRAKNIASFIQPEQFSN